MFFLEIPFVPSVSTGRFYKELVAECRPDSGAQYIDQTLEYFGVAVLVPSGSSSMVKSPNKSGASL